MVSRQFKDVRNVRTKQNKQTESYLIKVSHLSRGILCKNKINTFLPGLWSSLTFRKVCHNRRWMAATDFIPSIHQHKSANLSHVIQNPRKKNVLRPNQPSSSIGCFEWGTSRMRSRWRAKRHLRPTPSGSGSPWWSWLLLIGLKSRYLGLLT